MYLHRQSGTPAHAYWFISAARISSPLRLIVSDGAIQEGTS